MKIYLRPSLGPLFAFATLLFLITPLTAQTAALSFWNDGPAKQAIIKFVQATADP
jgi:hypothetical protein